MMIMKTATNPWKIVRIYRNFLEIKEILIDWLIDWSIVGRTVDVGAYTLIMDPWTIISSYSRPDRRRDSDSDQRDNDSGPWNGRWW